MQIINGKKVEFVLSLSYGKDSMACLGAIKHLGWPLDRIVTADIWATDTVRAEHPPMVAFKEKADKIIKERYGIEVEHYHAKAINGVHKDKVTYEDGFYSVKQKGDHVGAIYGFPMVKGQWCQKLKLNAVDQIETDADVVIQYLGIAADEPLRIATSTSRTCCSHSLSSAGRRIFAVCGVNTRICWLLHTPAQSATAAGFVIFKALISFAAFDTIPPISGRSF